MGANRGFARACRRPGIEGAQFYLTPFETLAPSETGMRLYTFCAAMEWGLVNHVYCFDAKRCSVAVSSR